MKKWNKHLLSKIACSFLLIAFIHTSCNKTNVKNEPEDEAIEIPASEGPITVIFAEGDIAHPDIAPKFYLVPMANLSDGYKNRQFELRGEKPFHIKADTIQFFSNAPLAMLHLTQPSNYYFAYTAHPNDTLYVEFQEGSQQ